MIPLVTASEAGKAQIWNLSLLRIVVYRTIFGVWRGISPLEQGIVEGDNPVHDLVADSMWYGSKESDSLGMLS